jgi:hypothetical protein
MAKFAPMIYSKAACRMIYGTMETLWNGYRAVFKFHALPVAFRVGGVYLLDAEIAGLGNDHVKHLAI